VRAARTGDICRLWTMSRRRSLLGEYLRARRALVEPEDVGIPRDPGRRVQGLRREEVARRAGISPEYYLHLEQGRDHKPSDQIIDALAGALDLDAESTDYLHRLAQRYGGQRPFHAPPAPVDDSIQTMLAQWSHTPAFVKSRNQDVLAANDLALALSPRYMEPGTNQVIQIFSATTRQHLTHWEQTARDLVAALRMQGDPDDPRLREIVGALSVCDPDFPRIWARHDTASLTTGRSHHRIDPIGWINLTWQNFIIPSTTHSLVVIWAEPGTLAAAAMHYLAARPRDEA
jgi:transcriptional regulator with XRE-family HTH domain